MRYLFVIILFVTIACNNSPQGGKVTDKADTLSYRYDSVKVYSSVKPVTTTVIDTAKVVIEFPVFSDSAISKMIEKQISESVDQDRKFKDYTDVATSFIKDFEKYHAEDTGSGALWFMEMHQRVSYNSPKLISILNTFFSFEGGAHPNTVYISYNIDPKTRTFLSIDSLIKPDSLDDFHALAEANFRKNENLTPDQGLEDGYFFENAKFKLPQTFSVSKRGILFTYSPYEIKAYAAGKTELMITYPEIKNMLNEKYAFLID